MTDETVKVIVNGLPGILVAMGGFMTVLTGLLVAIWQKLEKVHKQGNSLYSEQLQNTAIAQQALAVADPTPANIQAAERSRVILEQHKAMSKEMVAPSKSVKVELKIDPTSLPVVAPVIVQTPTEKPPTPPTK